MARTLPIAFFLLALIGGSPVTRAAPPPMPPALPELEPPRRSRPQPLPVRPTAEVGGTRLALNGLSQQAAWRWGGLEARQPQALWLPLEVLEGQLGFSSRSRPDGGLALEWFGRELVVPPGQQRSLADEVAVDVAAILRDVGVAVERRGELLDLRLPAPRLLQVRSSEQAGFRRVVLDLDGPTLVRSSDGGVQLTLLSRADQLAQLTARGLRSGSDGVVLNLSVPGVTAPLRLFTLGEPARVVIDLPQSGTATGTATTPPTAPAPIDPRLLALLGPQLRWDQQVRAVGGTRVQINAVRIDPRSGPLELRTLSRPDGMAGLSSLATLAQRQDALVAINGGFFNRVRRLPLGALRDQGRWLSGPILNRGAVGWDRRSLPRFGRLRLDEWISDDRGQRWPLLTVNSGYAQRGLSRYTAEWGRLYQALTGSETGVMLRGSRVQRRIGSKELAAGVALQPEDTLVVARGGAALPWNEGETLRLDSRPSDPLGNASSVMGGGPLLLQNGRIVLNGSAEGFGAAFLRQGAPRTVVGSDGSLLWLVTLEGAGGGGGPTLSETAWLLQQLGLVDALNLDGGSSTGLVMGGSHRVKGRGVAGSVHNGLGLVPIGGGEGANSQRLAN
ncbi:phosphodiester glycosidase family protein [Synechococcus sp. CS-1332]|uniref:phosphodiester glycosidase family protein n=1 Tax=Synechococcus sp. CS-1332 TaxID=2847972 RepID=UPI00223B76BD|nr:phosphodiester glycosidase family protein [Synechococcus sp. CS-1332]MCT0206170.1 phosphodiester glycosidase family protein [Synechococcus sp. CS-1332]